MKNCSRFKIITFLTLIIQLIIFDHITVSPNQYSNVSELEIDYTTIYELSVIGYPEIDKLSPLKSFHFEKVSFGTLLDERPFKNRLHVYPIPGCDVPEYQPEGVIVLHDKIETKNRLSTASLDAHLEIIYMDYGTLPLQIHEIKLKNILEDLNRKNKYQNFSKSFYQEVDKFTKEFEDSRRLFRELEGAFAVTYDCRRKAKFGGLYRQRRPDGEKYVCLDPESRLNSRHCLVYAFGIGNDFSFEREAALFGCDVYAFDDDERHGDYPVDPFYRVNFFNQRLGTHLSGELQVLNDKVGYPVLYNSLPNLLRVFEHQEAVLDYLKIDIENAEWDVFENSLFESGVLSRTRFLGVETHFDDLKHLTHFKDPEKLRSTLSRYTRFFSKLQELGFLVMHTEPNYYRPEFVRMFTDDGEEYARVSAFGAHVVSVYAETVWVNPGVPKVSGPRVPPSRPMSVKAAILDAPAQI